MKNFFKLTKSLPFVEPSWHLCVGMGKRRDKLVDFLKCKGIETMIHYPIPPHRQEAYKKDFNIELDIADRLSKKCP